MAAITALVPLSVVACGASGDDPATDEADSSKKKDAAVPPLDSGNDTKPPRRVKAPPLPVIPNQGGPIIAKPELVTVTWAGDSLATDLEDFDRWLITSATWKTMMAEWDVGPGTYAGAARLAGAAPATISEDDVATILRAGFQAGTIPAPNGSRIYMIYPPTSTVVTSFGVKGCEAFQAYHSAVDVAASEAGAATKAIFSITPRCAETQGLSPLDYVTWGSSHEAMEAASDPINADPAWRIDNQSLATPELGENADLCAGHPTKIEGHMITRNWSNDAAKAGERPCVPAPAGPMFGIFADPGEVTVTPGQSTTVTIRAYAAGAMPAFSVGAFAVSPSLTPKISVKTANEGDVLKLTLDVAADYVEEPGANIVFLYSQGEDYLTKRHLIVHAR